MELLRQLCCVNNYQGQDESTLTELVIFPPVQEFNIREICEANTHNILNEEKIKEVQEAEHENRSRKARFNTRKRNQRNNLNVNKSTGEGRALVLSPAMPPKFLSTVDINTPFKGIRKSPTRKKVPKKDLEETKISKCGEDLNTYIKTAKQLVGTEIKDVHIIRNEKTGEYSSRSLGRINASPIIKKKAENPKFAKIEENKSSLGTEPDVDIKTKQKRIGSQIEITSERLRKASHFTLSRKIGGQKSARNPKVKTITAILTPPKRAGKWKGDIACINNGGSPIPHTKKAWGPGKAASPIQVARQVGCSPASINSSTEKREHSPDQILQIRTGSSPLNSLLITASNLQNELQRYNNKDNNNNKSNPKNNQNNIQNNNENHNHNNPLPKHPGRQTNTQCKNPNNYGRSSLGAVIKTGPTPPITGRLTKHRLQKLPGPGTPGQRVKTRYSKGGSPLSNSKDDDLLCPSEYSGFSFVPSYYKPGRAKEIKLDAELETALARSKQMRREQTQEFITTSELNAKFGEEISLPTTPTDPTDALSSPTLSSKHTTSNRIRLTTKDYLL